MLPIFWNGSLKAHLVVTWLNFIYKIIRKTLSYKSGVKKNVSLGLSWSIFLSQSLPTFKEAWLVFAVHWF